MCKKLLFFMTALLMAFSVAAEITVTGTVIDKSLSEPLPGVTVQIKGAKGKAIRSTVTDIDGKFTIKAPGEGTKIHFSFIGMAPVEAKASASPLNIEMSPESTSLQEVVVTGMGTQDKRLFTGATTKLDAKETMLSGVGDVSRSLEGRAAGVTVQNVSGTFGTAPKIRVRGATSIYGSSKPLWVVDGVILEDNVELDADALSSGDANTLIPSAVA